MDHGRTLRSRTGPVGSFTVLLFSSLSLSCAVGSALAPSRSAANYRSDAHGVPEDVRIGVEALAAGNDELASQAFNRAVKNHPYDASAHVLNGLAYQALVARGDSGAVDYAAVAYDTALKLDPSNPTAAYLRGTLEFFSRDYRRSQDDFARALLANRDDARAAYGLAAASYYAGDLPTARSAILRAAELSPENAHFAKGAALVLAATGEDSEADRFYRSFVAESARPAGEGQLRKRLDQWRELYASPAPVEIAQMTPPVAPGATPGANVPGLQPTAEGWNSGSPQTNSTLPAAPLPGGRTPRMIFFDLIILRQEETQNLSQGLNLLDGLRLVANGSVLHNLTTGLANTRTIVGGLTVPAVNYSLNIVNADATNIEVLARPSLVATEGSTTQFFSGDTLTVALAGQYGGTLQDKNVGLDVSLTPIFLDDNTVQVTVRAARTFLEPTTGGTFTSVLQTSQNQITASVVLKLADTLVLGGLFEKERTWQKGGVPFLQGIPLIQYLFSERTKTNFEKSILFLITPRPVEYLRREQSAENPARVGQEPPLPHVRELMAHGRNLFKPVPNLDAILRHLESNDYYRQIRSGDLEMEDFKDPEKINALTYQVLQMLYY